MTYCYSFFFSLLCNREGASGVDRGGNRRAENRERPAMPLAVEKGGAEESVGYHDSEEQALLCHGETTF